MFTRNIKDTFTANLLNAVSGVLSEAKKKKCSEGCECEACTPEETNEGCMPTNDMPSAKDRKTAGKLGDLLKRERDAKEKKEPNGVKTEEADMPFEKPYRKAGERKDEYGNKIKNVAKHLAKKAMKANEEVEELEEKRGLWDNIHAKRKRIKAGSGEKMRKPGSEGAPTAADLKASANEAFEQIDEISKATMGRYINKAKDSIDMASYRQGHKEAHGSSSRPLEKKLSKRHKGIETAVKKLTKEESEQIDELSKDTMGRYIKKAATKIGTQGVTAGLKIAKDERSKNNFDTIGKRERGISTAVKKLTKEEQDFIDALNDADMEQIDELSDTALKVYVGNAYNDYLKKSKNRMPGEDETDAMKKRKNSLSLAHKKLDKKLAKEEVEELDELSVKTLDQYRTKARKDIIDTDDSDEKRINKRAKGYMDASKQVQKKLAKEEVELDEARGRPKKAGARDFTIHPKTKEKLMHNNPEHMKRIERLQKNGILPKPNTEANQHIMQQLQRVKTSMRGGETVNFTHGDPTHVSGTHASKLLDKYAGMKPDEKEAFQKKIGHSHANLKSEL